jgi:dephospho-CoA kinase
LHLKSDNDLNTSDDFCKIFSMILGITGGMGCGKTTAAKLISELGYERLDSDGIIRSHILTSEPIIHALRQRYGDPILDPNGAVDRARLAGIIFSQADELEWLERIFASRALCVLANRHHLQPRAILDRRSSTFV